MTINILDEIAEEEAKLKKQIITTSQLPPTPPMPMDIVIRIPQKFNISCCVSRGDLVVGGGQHNYDDNGKLEGDVHLPYVVGTLCCTVKCVVMKLHWRA